MAPSLDSTRGISEGLKYMEITLGLLNGLGAVGVVLIMGWLLATGRLFTRRQYDELGHDRNEWRAAHRISETARQVAADQVAELLEHARTTDAFIRSLPYGHKDSS